jgi:hypothetical protein
VTDRNALIAAQSGALAAMLAQPGDTGMQGGAGESRVEGGKLTPKGRAMLTAVAAARDGAATPEYLIRRYPQAYAGDVRSVTSSLHRTAAHLVNQGYLKRGRVQARGARSGQVQGGRRTYRITAAGREAL